MISSVAALFYPRRSRNPRTFDDLDPPPPSSSSSTSSSNCAADNNRHRNNNHHHHPHRRRGHRRNHNHENNTNYDDDRSIPPFTVVYPFDPFSLPVSEFPRDCINGSPESPSPSILNREVILGLSRRHVGSSRLPAPVLLARERLLQRLRGGSVSEVRESGQVSASANHNETILSDLSAEANLQSSVAQGSSERHVGLTTETMSQLHHEVFLESEKVVGDRVTETSRDCCICLENFVEGNELITLQCGHRFHTTCLYPWLQSSGECPYCRSRVTVSC